MSFHLYRAVTPVRHVSNCGAFLVVAGFGRRHGAGIKSQLFTRLPRACHVTANAQGGTDRTARFARSSRGESEKRSRDLQPIKFAREQSASSSHRMSGAKEVRADAVVFQVNVGRMAMLRGPWNAAGG